jgi:hypothetical protein
MSRNFSHNPHVHHVRPARREWVARLGVGENPQFVIARADEHVEAVAAVPIPLRYEFC